MRLQAGSCGTEDLSDADDLYQPWHAVHLVAQCREVAALLELPPGSRFLLAADHLETWHDESLLDI